MTTQINLIVAVEMALSSRMGEKKSRKCKKNKSAHHLLATFKRRLKSLLVCLSQMKSFFNTYRLAQPDVDTARLTTVGKAVPFSLLGASI